MSIVNLNASERDKHTNALLHALYKCSLVHIHLQSTINPYLVYNKLRLEYKHLILSQE